MEHAPVLKLPHAVARSAEDALEDLVVVLAEPRRREGKGLREVRELEGKARNRPLSEHGVGYLADHLARFEVRVLDGFEI